LILPALAFLVIFGSIFYAAFSGEYTTYAGDKFIYSHYGEMDNVFTDTIRVLSITVREDKLIVRTVGDKNPLIIKQPDRLEVVNGRP
jgi:hypothetical protein